MSSDENKVSTYELFMLALCIFVLLALAADTFFPLGDAASLILGYVDTGVCIIFLIDFFVKVTTADSKLKYLRWGWLDLVSSIPMIGFLRWGRIARVVRILRVLRGARSAKVIVAHLLKHRAHGAFASACLISIVLVTTSSIAILHCEVADDANIATAEDALWWSLVTITTVGYGDKYPVTTEGHIVAVVLMMAGIGLFGTFTGFVASWFLSPGEKEQEAEMEAIRRELVEIKKLLIRRDEPQST